MMSQQGKIPVQLPSVTIIVLNYNGLTHLEDCFSSLTQLDYPTKCLELMMVDNASSDDSVNYIKTHYPDVRIVRTRENLGFAAGNNVGAREATSPYIVFLNNDTRVDPQFVFELINVVQGDAQVICVSAKMLNWEGSEFDFAGAAAHFAGFGYQLGLTEPFSAHQFTESSPCLFACGGAMLIDRQIFLDSGGFDEDYFAYFEDVDLGWRLWLLGYKVMFAPAAIAYHRHHGTSDKLSDYRKRVLHKRNTLYSVLKNYNDENLGRVLPAVLMASVESVVQAAVERGQLILDEYRINNPKKYFRSTVSLDKEEVSTLVAIHEVVNHLPQVMEKRRFVQTHRQRSDEDVAGLFRHPFRYWPDVTQQTQAAVVNAFDIQQLFAHLPQRILVISSDILPYPGLPTVGSGLRAWGIGQGLKSRGHEVIFSMPHAALAGREEMVPPEVKALAWEHHTLRQVVTAVEPDAVVVCNWPVLALLPTENLNMPVILDQHGPHNLEREFQQFGNPEENARQKLNALRKADFFTCAGARQLDYFQAWLDQAGWTEQQRRDLAGVIPFSLSADMPERQLNEELTFVYGGVFLPWQDPSLGLSTLIQWMETQNCGKLYFFGGKHPVYPVNTGIFETLLAQIQDSPHVVAPGMVSHSELIENYRRAHVAFDVMKRNKERELAFTSRTVEYLWCGLPVIYHDYAELSDYIAEYEAGWLVDPTDPAAITAILNEIAAQPEQVIQRGKNAQRLVRERLSWDKTISPLDDFIRHPQIRSGKVAKIDAPPPNARYLLNEITRHYRRGGPKIVWEESLNFLRKRVNSW